MVKKSSAVAAFLILVLASIARCDDRPQQDSLGRDYYLYAPAPIDPAKTYWLVVGVHGYGGNGQGAAGLSDWARRGDCIVVGPSFPNEGYQLLREQADEQLVKLFESLQTKYKLHPKLFLYGFSGGAQFAHRIMMVHPELVAGCSAHSGGTWATGGQWMDINPQAADIPFVMSCGEADTGKSVPDAPMSRYDWARAFDKDLADAGFCYEARYWPRTAHAVTPGVAAMTTECYRIATLVNPKFECSLEEIQKLIDGGKVFAARASIARLRQPTPSAAAPLAKAVAEHQKKKLDALSQQLNTVSELPKKNKKTTSDR